MRTFITTHLDAFRQIADRSGHIRIHTPNENLIIPLTGPDEVSAWLCNGREASDELVTLWSRGTHPRHILLLVKDASSIPRLQRCLHGRAATVSKFPSHLHPHLPWAESILRSTERMYAAIRAETAQPIRNILAPASLSGVVLLVGAGVVNLMTAEFLASKGYQVRLIDSSPDPRVCDDWKKLGVTHGGGNARMYTRTEADNYNEKGSKIYQNMKSVFRRTTREGGWSVKLPETFSPAELAWVAAFEQLPAWLARSFREDIFEINLEAGKLWDKLIKETPELFEDVEFRQDILRMYVETDALEASVLLHQEIGAMINNTTPEEFLTAHPGFTSAFKADELAGGYTVKGFTVNIHPFVAKLMQRIEDLGGDLIWNCKAEGIARNAGGEVTGIQTHAGLVQAEHYVLSPGSTGNHLLRGTASEDLLQGVLGVWLQIPNLEPRLEHSIKIHRRGHLVEDINVTVATDLADGSEVLMLGGGYGYVGLDRPAPESPELMALFHELEEVARIYFPRGHALAKETGRLWPGNNYKFCVRPFTSTGLGVFEIIPTANGGSLVITGGNNTGGFAQAPAIARAVYRALDGQIDPIHALFHPERGQLFKTSVDIDWIHEELETVADGKDDRRDSPLARALL